MNAVDFCFWLQGYFELNVVTEINKHQAGVIQKHLTLVFEHQIDPLRESEVEVSKDALDAIHGGLESSAENDPLVRC